uniref:Uncharacterized protein n=1 Tax=Arundo donax TaxID=35708 RepID=A0A0A9B696_ARUDO
MTSSSSFASKETWIEC